VTELPNALSAWRATLVVAAILLIGGCATNSLETASTSANVDPYSIDPPKPYPTPSLPANIDALTARAATGDPIAECRLGVVYKTGQHVRVSFASAIKWFTRSAAQHDGCGITNLGNMYFQGNGVPQSYSTARAYYEAGARTGYPAAFYDLGEIYKYGDDVPIDERAATEWLEKAATANVTLAYTELGDLYAFGHRFKVHNAGLAVQYYRKAVATHDTDTCGCAEEHRQRAADNLAFLYLNVYKGDDRERYRLVLDLLHKSGDAWSDEQLAEMYQHGLGVKRNHDAAESLYKKSADLGYAPAATKYAAFMFGWGGEPVHAKTGLAYLREAVAGGDADAMGELATIEWNGVLVPRDKSAAIKWLTLAAAHGSLISMNDLANRYYVGAGVPRDRYKAYILFHVEADTGAHWGPGVKQRLEKELTQQQLASAQFEINAMDQSVLTALDEETFAPPTPSSANAVI
jgi:TPR repeat protein